MNTQAKAAVAAVALTIPLVLSSQASAQTKWICEVPDVGQVTFVTAADAARHGIDTANTRAGTVFYLRFGERCRVESG
jgi:hypothetical protein